MEIESGVVKPHHVMHPDDERFDRLTIDIVPRWKESELSGDEYRFNYEGGFWRKGELIVKTTTSRMSDILTAIPMLFGSYPADGHTFDEDAWNRTLDKCDQPGCDLVATVFYELKKHYTKNGQELLKQGWDRQYRQFCENHKNRGDAGLDDADHNYIPISDQRLL